MIQAKLKISEPKLAMGLMSGTSCDGLDVVLLTITGARQSTEFEFIAGKSYSYSKKIRSELLSLLKTENNDAAVLSQLNFYLAQIWAEMVIDFLKSQNIAPEKVHFIGSHGQTIWHQPVEETLIDLPIISTFQLGDPSVLAKLTGITVVGDFRVADMALGGKGAPLIPYFDWVYFSRFKKNMLVVNIGGISNFTFIPADGNMERVVAFDCGPGNLLIDHFAHVLFKRPMDVNGKLAQKGRLVSELLQYLQKIDPFVETPPPKSTGREHYDATFTEKIAGFIKRHNINAYDAMHTISYYTAQAIWKNYRQFVKPNGHVQQVVVSGGGARNPFIMNQLKQMFDGVDVHNSERFGLQDEFKEAIGFAILANETLLGNPSNVPQATGAQKATVLGKICLP